MGSVLGSAALHLGPGEDVATKARMFVNEPILLSVRIRFVYVGERVVFDGKAMIAAMDAQRSMRDLDWNALALDLWEQSSDLNAQLGDHGMCSGALVRTAQRGTMSCQYALTILRWIRRAPEDFLTRPVAEISRIGLPKAGPDLRLRWDLSLNPPMGAGLGG